MTYVPYTNEKMRRKRFHPVVRVFVLLGLIFFVAVVIYGFAHPAEPQPADVQLRD